jgi:hypothetical protein
MDDYKEYAFCAENKVFFIHKIYVSQDSFKTTCESYEQNPTFIDCTNNPNASLITKGWTFDGENFLSPQEKSDNKPHSIGNHYKYALVSNNKVTSWLMFPKDEPDSIRFKSNLEKNPIILDISNLVNPPKIGWTFDGENFLSNLI